MRNNILSPRLKNFLLTEVEGKLFYYNRPYNGVVFYEKHSNMLEAYEVVEGEIVRTYISPCIIATRLDLNISNLIDATEFSCINEDIYDSGVIPQMYNEKIFNGLAFTFINGVCNREYYTNEDGIVVNQVEWNPDNFSADSFDIEVPNAHQWFYYYFGNFCFIQENQKFQNEGIRIEYDFNLNNLSRFEITGNILDTRNYLSCPVRVPKIFEIIENCQKQIFSSQTNLQLNGKYSKNLFQKWSQNNSFKLVEILSITGIENFDNLLLFNDKTIFSSLKRLYISKEIPNKMIEELKSTNPNFEIKVL